MWDLTSLGNLQVRRSNVGFLNQNKCGRKVELWNEQANSPIHREGQLGSMVNNTPDSQKTDNSLSLPTFGRVQKFTVRNSIRQTSNKTSSLCYVQPPIIACTIYCLLSASSMVSEVGWHRTWFVVFVWVTHLFKARIRMNPTATISTSSEIFGFDGGLN